MNIFICSKLRGDIKRNTERAKQFSREVLMQGHIPFTPHIYFTLFLDELNEEERNQGINAGLEWLKLCDEMWVFDEEISEGMQKEIDYAIKNNIKVKEVVKKDGKIKRT